METVKARIALIKKEGISDESKTIFAAGKMVG